jgi:hypothetical protein
LQIQTAWIKKKNLTSSLSSGVVEFDKVAKRPTHRTETQRKVFIFMAVSLVDLLHRVKPE